MSKLIRLALREGPVPHDEPNRVGPEPIGMTAERWPYWEGEPMFHAITLARENIAVELPEHVAAVAVFIRSLALNEAFEPSTNESALVFLTMEDLARGTTTGQDVLGRTLVDEEHRSGVILVDTVDYDFDEVVNFEDEEARPETDLDEDDISFFLGAFLLSQLEGKIDDCSVYGISGPHTYWLQAAESPDGHRMLFHFYEDLVPGLNCGTGMLYVTANKECTEGSAWFQC